MPKIVVAFLFCLISSIVNAQAFESQKPVLCDNTQKLISALGEHWKEVPIWTAKDASNDSRYSLFVNQKTGSWTLLQLTPTIACIIGVGDGSKFFLGTAI